MTTCWADGALPSPNRDRKTVKTVKLQATSPRDAKTPRNRWLLGVFVLFRLGSGLGCRLGPGRGTRSLVLGQHELADADRDRSDLDALVLAAELQGLLQADRKR